MTSPARSVADATAGRDAPRPEALGRRDRKKVATRDRLMNVGATMFASKGFDETTTADIAEAADVSQRTLFRHFKTKEALLYGDMEEALAELRLTLAARPADEPVLAALRHSLAALADNFERHRESRLLQARLAGSSPSVSAYSRASIQLQWEREIIEALSARLAVDPMSDPRPEIVAGATMSAIRIATRQWVASDGRADFMELMNVALEAIGRLADLDSGCHDDGDTRHQDSETHVGTRTTTW